MTGSRGSPSQVTDPLEPILATPLDAEAVRTRVDRALAALLHQELDRKSVV